MADSVNLVRAMAATMLADETPLFSAGLKLALTDITKDYFMQVALSLSTPSRSQKRATMVEDYRMLTMN